jgi:hypothetical protein
VRRFISARTKKSRRIVVVDGDLLGADDHPLSEALRGRV